MSDETPRQPTPPTTILERVREFADQLAADAPGMGESMPEGEVLAYVAERLHGLIDGDQAAATETCDECGWTVPAEGPMHDDAHASTCSLHPGNIVQP